MQDYAGRIRTDDSHVDTACSRTRSNFTGGRLQSIVDIVLYDDVRQSSAGRPHPNTRNETLKFSCCDDDQTSH